MKVSVITTTFNSAATLERNISSVNSQEWADLEHVFIDNVSTDGTLEIINRCSTRLKKVISERDKGISDAFNKGIQHSSGEIIAVLNSDDAFFDSTTLSRVHEAFFKNPELEFVHGDMLFVDPVHGTNVRKPLQCPITHGMPFNHPAFFVRRSFYDKLGLFDEKYKFAMDFELIARMYQAPSQPTLKGFYLKGSPLTVMYAGGVSWTQELKAVKEVQLALQQHGLWNKEAEKEMKKWTMRVHLKDFLNALGLQRLVKTWRYFKWKNP